MDKTEVSVFETTLQKIHDWLRDLMRMCDWDSQQQAYLALEAVLQSLRDRLPVAVTAKLGAQLPMLIRGMYYEGWVPSHTPIKIKSQQGFFSLVSSHLGSEPWLFNEIRDVVRNVFHMITLRLSSREIEHLKKVPPLPIASLWDNRK